MLMDNVATLEPKNKGRRLHRHPAFFGTMKECMEDCCEVLIPISSHIFVSLKPFISIAPSPSMLTTVRCRWKRINNISEDAFRKFSRVLQWL